MIADAIKDALLDWCVVVIPDLGTFWSEESGAEVSPSGNIIKPPHVNISFSENIEEKDLEVYSLIQFIAKSEDLDPDEVAIQVSMFVANIQQRLEDGETATVGNMGYFVQDDDGTLTFRQKSENNIIPESFGLPKITATPLLNDDIEEDVPIYQEEEAFSGEEELESSKRPVWLLVSIPIIILLTVVGYFVMKPSNTTQSEIVEEEVIEQQVEDSEIDESVAAEDVDDAADIDSEQEENTPVEETTVEKEEVVVEESEPATRNGHYHIVIASFGDRKNAQKAVQKAESKGFDYVGVIESKGKFRVAIKGFVSHQDAKEELPKAQESFKGAWIIRI
ncbi:SPOR domain-containing protein [Flammeovirga sp. SubArs3]|uniref:SPOR domain-containing protein n=1 Tax=Flammeovirga sp. SubArs3 TaxID=2995316 RepID=UPI00248D299C|nr:SPOR domain-containing protein [Flammeovirga sp. SubArs3]